MTRWALTFLVNRLVLVAVFLGALNAFTQGSSCQSGDSQGLMSTLSGLPKAFESLSNAIRK